jgi:hypothetical protein
MGLLGRHKIIFVLSTFQSINLSFMSIKIFIFHEELFRSYIFDHFNTHQSYIALLFLGSLCNSRSYFLEQKLKIITPTAKGVSSLSFEREANNYKRI